MLVALACVTVSVIAAVVFVIAFTYFKRSKLLLRNRNIDTKNVMICTSGVW